MSVALYDLKCPTYDYVKRMTWAEFLIRLHGFKREKENDMLMLRELSWIVYTSPHNDPKKMKKTKDAFWPVKKHKKELSDSAKERMKEVMIEYLKQKENG
jgi:hypothetical protein